jgi:hypothetical protein
MEKRNKHVGLLPFSRRSAGWQLRQSHNDSVCLVSTVDKVIECGSTSRVGWVCGTNVFPRPRKPATAPSYAMTLLLVLDYVTNP